MCGRYSMSIGSDELADYLARTNLTLDRIINKEDSRPSYNVAPTTNVPVYRQENQRQDNGGEQPIREVQYMRWGVIPSWSKEPPSKGSGLKTFNCRSDKLQNHVGLWASLKNTKRCVAIAEGYYEWKTIGSTKIPYFIKNKDDAPLFFAALWDHYRFEGNDVYSFTIVTHDSKGPLQEIHQRTPTLIAPDSDDLKMWLDPSVKWNNKLQDIADQCSVEDGNLEFFEVSDEVGKVANNYETLKAPVKHKKSTGLLDNFFLKGAQAKDAEMKTRENTEIDDKDDLAPGNSFGVSNFEGIKIIKPEHKLEEESIVSPSNIKSETVCATQESTESNPSGSDDGRTIFNYKGLQESIDLFQDIMSHESSVDRDGVLQELFETIHKIQLKIQQKIESSTQNGRGNIEKLLWCNDLINNALDKYKASESNALHLKRDLSPTDTKQLLKRHKQMESPQTSPSKSPGPGCPKITSFFAKEKK